MAINFGKNVFYEGALPNFERDRYSSLSEMQKAGNEGRLDEGHICYVVAEGQHFVWRGAGLGCLPLESESSGDGSSSGGTVAYRGGAGIDVSGNYISFKYGTALYPHEQDKTIGLQYDEWYFTINEPSEATHRTGLSLRLSTNGGIESVTYGEIQGISVKHDETMEIVKNELGVKLGTNLYATSKGVSLKLGTKDEPAGVCRGLENHYLNGLGVACGNGLGYNFEDKLEVKVNGPLKAGSTGLSLSIGNGLYISNGQLCASGGGDNSGYADYSEGDGINISNGAISLSYNDKADALSFSPLHINQSKELDLRLHNNDFTFDDNSKNIRVNPNVLKNATGYIKLGTAMYYDKNADVIDVGVKAPVVKDNGAIGLKLGNGLRVGALGGLEIDPYAVLSAGSLNGSPFYQDSDSILRMRLADKVYNDSRYANPLKMTEASMNGNVLTPGGLTLNIGPGLYTYNGKLALQYSTKLFYINEGGYLDIHLDALKAALNGEIVG